MKLHLRFVTVSLLLMIISVGGCNYSQTGYRAFAERNSLCSISFEYSTYYRLSENSDLKHKEPWYSFDLIAPSKPIKLVVPDPARDTVKTVESSYAPAYIEGLVWNPTAHPKNALERLEIELGLDSWENYELLERSPVTISGVEGEMLYYVVDWFLPVPIGEGPQLKHVKALFFDYDGLIWMFKATSEPGMVDRVMADFEHILETFRFLD